MFHTCPSEKGGGVWNINNKVKKISVITPVLNECPWIGFSVMAADPYVHEFVYVLDEKSDDGTRELLHHLKSKYLKEKIKILEHPTFHPHNQKAYNGAFNRAIAEMTGDVAMFLHPDMVITEGPKNGIPEDALAWWVEMKSYAGDLKTLISKGRCGQWKNLHAKTLGLHYFGGYGSQNEDFYHSAITGTSYKHYGTEFSKYPFKVMAAGIKVNHYCEAKNYKRRLEKMQLCLRTLYPDATEALIEDLAVQHPRVSLQDSSLQFGKFEFKPSEDDIPPVFEKYGAEFNAFIKEPVSA